MHDPTEQTKVFRIIRSSSMCHSIRCNDSSIARQLFRLRAKILHANANMLLHVSPLSRADSLYIRRVIKTRLNARRDRGFWNIMIFILCIIKERRGEPRPRVFLRMLRCFQDITRQLPAMAFGSLLISNFGFILAFPR